MNDIQAQFQKLLPTIEYTRSNCITSDSRIYPALLEIFESGYRAALAAVAEQMANEKSTVKNAKKK